MKTSIKYMLKVRMGFLKNRRNLQGINFIRWIHKFELFDKSDDIRKNEILHFFLTSKIKKIKECMDDNTSKIILFCVIKDDLDKVRLLIHHYRKLGVKKFVFLDNCSSDGTKEFLCQQEDAFVYECKEEYSSVKRVAWLNRMLALHGDDSWCMVVDSDEFVTYKECEKYTLNDLIKCAEKKNIKRIEGFLLDMYPKDEIFSGHNTNNLIGADYFDQNTYKMKSWKYGTMILGGPRYRVFHRKVQLSKYPLFYMGEEDFLVSSHAMFPVYPVKKTPIWLAICHYKFIDKKDIIKIKVAVEKENYASESADYKAYLSKMEGNCSIVMYDKKVSIKMNTSKDLDTITFLASPFK